MCWMRLKPPILHSFMAKMTKAQIIRELADKSGQAKKDIEAILDLLANLAYKQVKSVGEFLVPGF